MQDLDARPSPSPDALAPSAVPLWSAENEELSPSRVDGRRVRIGKVGWQYDTRKDLTVGSSDEV